MAGILEVERNEFCDLISSYSEDRWCAGWLYDIDKIVREQGGHWTAYALRCGGWPLGYRGEDGWDPVTLEEAEAFRVWLKALCPLPEGFEV